MPTTKLSEEQKFNAYKDAAGEILGELTQQVENIASVLSKLSKNLGKSIDKTTSTYSNLTKQINALVEDAQVSSNDVTSVTKDIVKTALDMVKQNQGALADIPKLKESVQNYLKKFSKISDASVIEEISKQILDKITQNEDALKIIQKRDDDITKSLSDVMSNIFTRTENAMKNAKITTDEINDVRNQISKAIQEFVDINHRLLTASELDDILVEQIQKMKVEKQNTLIEALSSMAGSYRDQLKGNEQLAAMVSGSNEFAAESTGITANIIKQLMPFAKDLKMTPEILSPILSDLIKVVEESRAKAFGVLPSVKVLEKDIKAFLQMRGLDIAPAAKIAGGITEVYQKNIDKMKMLRNEVEELSYELLKPFSKMTDWIDKIPGGKVLSKMFGFEEIKRRIREDIIDSLENIHKQKPFDALKTAGVAVFKVIGEAAKALLAHPVLLAIALIVGAIYLAKKAFDKVLDSAKALRDETGLVGQEAYNLSIVNSEIANRLTAMGVSMEVLGKSTAALVNEFGSTAVLSQQLYENMGLMVGALGVSAETAAKTARIFRTMGGLSDEMVGNLSMATANAAKFGKVAPSKVFDDLAQSSKEIYTYFKGNIKEAAKAAIEFRRLGTSLKEVANTAKSLMNFESSITSELEASVLVGKHFTFQRARALIFQNDLKGANDEIIKQVESIGDIENMNYIQKEAIAKAAGMELDQLLNMVKQSRELNKLGYAERVEYEASLQALDNFRKVNKLTLAQENQRLLATEQMNAAWQNLLFILGKSIMPIFEAIYETLQEIGQIFMDAFGITDVTKSATQLKDTIKLILKPLVWISEILGKIIWFFQKINNLLGGSFVGAVLAAVAAIKVLQLLIRGVFGMTGSLFTKFFSGFTNMIKTGFGYIGKGISNMWSSWTHGVDGAKNKFGKFLDFFKSKSKTAPTDITKGAPTPDVETVGKQKLSILKRLSTAIKELSQVIKNTLKLITTTIVETVRGLSKILTSIVKLISTFVTDLLRGVSKILTEVVKLVSTFATDLLKGVSKILTGAVKLVSTLATDIINGLSQILTGVVNLIAKVFNSFVPVVNTIGKIVQSLVGTISKSFVTLMQGLGKGIQEFVTAISKIKPSDAIKAALAIVLLAGALYVFSLAVQPFANIGWDALAKAGVALLGLAIVGMLVGQMSSNILIGALAIALLGAALIPLAFALDLMKNVSWDTLAIAGVALVGFALAAFALGAIMFTGVGALLFAAGIVAIIALGGAIAVLGLSLMLLEKGKGGMKVMTKAISDLAKLGAKLLVVAVGIGAIAISMAILAVVGPGIILAAIGITMLAGALKLLAPSLKEVFEAMKDIIDTIGKTITDIIDSISTAVKTAGEAISSVIATMADSIVKLGNVNAVNLMAVAGGLTAISTALAGFGVGSAVGGIGKAIGSLFGGDQMDEIFKLATLAPGITATAEAIKLLSESLKNLSVPNISGIEQFSQSMEKLSNVGSTSLFEGISNFMGGLFEGDPMAKFEKFAQIAPNLSIAANSIKTMADSFANFVVPDIDVEKFSKIAELSMKGTATAPPVVNVEPAENEGIIKRLDLVIDAIEGMKVVMDGRVVGEVILESTAPQGRG